MARTEQRLTRKDLRQPDEFQTLTRQAMVFVEENRTAVMAALGAVIVLLLAIVAYRMISQSREASASAAYTEARALLTDKKYGEAATKFDDGRRRAYSGTSYGPLALLERGNALAPRRSSRRCRHGLRALPPELAADRLSPPARPHASRLRPGEARQARRRRALVHDRRRRARTVRRRGAVRRRAQRRDRPATPPRPRISTRSSSRSTRRASTATSPARI